MLPVIFSKNFITKINKLMNQFVWGSKWKRVGRNTFCSSFEKGGANMIHLQSYLTALHAKYLSCLFNKSFFSQWKTIKSLFFDHNLLYAVLTSNLKVASKMIQKLLPLRSLTTSFSVLKNFVGASFAEENLKTHLWLNKFVKYNGKSMFIKEFPDAGVLDARQLIGPNGIYKTYDDVAAEYHLFPNNQSFVEYVKLISAIPLDWQFDSNYINRRRSYIHDVIENLELYGKSAQSFYCYLFSKVDSPPFKRQSRSTNELNLPSDSVNWLDAYKSNYSATPETKLRSFQVKLNLRAIVTYIALHCFDIADSDKCSFCMTERETLLHLFCTCLVLFW